MILTFLFQSTDFCLFPIGLRMGRITTKTALVAVLKNYHFECVDDRELIMTNHGLTLAVEGSINLRISNRLTDAF